MAKPPKFKTPFPHLDDLDDLDQTGVVGGVEIPIEQLPASSPKASTPADAKKANDGNDSAKLDIASAGKTRAAIRGMQHSDAMRSALDRLRDIEGVDDFDADEVDDTDNTDEIGIQPEVNYENLPAVVSRTVALPDQEKIEWHKVENLPGYRSSGIRNMGRNEFERFTKTPQGDIVTIAYLKPPGNQPIDPESTQRNPNTPGEVLKVVKWLQDNATDLGTPAVPEIRHPIPGYKTKIRHFTANGIRFQVVMDSIDDEIIGYYVYAWPERDSRNSGNEITYTANTPLTKQLRENKNMFDKNKFVQLLRESQIEETKCRQFIDKLVKDFILSEARQNVSEVRGVEARSLRRRGENASLTRLIGDKPGGKELIRNLHRKHQLSDTAKYVDHDMNQRILWKLFKSHPDNFQIIIASNGVAGIKPFEKDIERGEAIKGTEYNPATDNTLRYQIVAFREKTQINPDLLRAPGTEPEERDVDPTVMQARGGVPSRADPRAPNIFDRLREQIGTLQRLAITTGAVEREKIKQRAKLKKEKSLNYADARNQVINKLIGRPGKKSVLVRLVQQVKNGMHYNWRTTNDTRLARKILGQIDILDKLFPGLDSAKGLQLLQDSPFYKIFDKAVNNAVIEYESDKNNEPLPSPKNLSFLKGILDKDVAEKFLKLQILYTQLMISLENVD